MKIILIPIFIAIIFTIGCENTMNTPTSKVESFLGKYQKMDTDVVKELKEVLKEDTSMTKEEKEIYQSLLEKQYQNLSYKIKNEEVEKNHATVDVEIEVLDYKTSINKSKKYYEDHIDEFKETKEENNKKTYMEYKLEELKKVNNKIKYEMTFSLTKTDGIWIMDNLTDIDRKKIHGLY